MNIRLAFAPFKLEASATALDLKLTDESLSGDEETPIMHSFRPFYAEALFMSRAEGPTHTGDVSLGRARVEALEVAAGTPLRIWYDDLGCLAMKVLSEDRSSRDLGLSLEFSELHGTQSETAVTSIAYIPQGGIVQICGMADFQELLVGKVSDVSLVRVYHDQHPRLEMSSVLSGRLSLTNTSKKWALSSNDRVRLSKLRDALLSIRYEDRAIHLALSGVMERGSLIGNETLTSKGENLVPSLLSFVYDSPFGLFVGLTIGLFGALWNTVRLIMR